MGVCLGKGNAKNDAKASGAGASTTDAQKQEPKMDVVPKKGGGEDKAANKKRRK